jgi:protein TonB
VADRRRPDADLPPPASRVGDRALAFAAAFTLHAAILLPFLMHLEARRQVAPGAAAVMVNIIRADGPAKAAKAEPEKPAEKPAEKPSEKTEPPRQKPVPLKTPVLEKPLPSASAPAARSSSAAPSSSAATNGKPGGVAVSGASEAGVGNATAQASYLDKLQSWLASHKRYPKAARRLRIEGVAILHFTLARDGSVISHTIEKSSGSEILDREVEEMLERAAPLPAPPPTLRGDELDFRFPIRFRMDD